MASITWNSPSGNKDATTQAFGRTFVHGKSVELDPTADAFALRKARTNPEFEVSASEEEEKKAEALGRYHDPASGQSYLLFREAPLATGGGAGTGPVIVPPSAGTQGSIALDTRPEAFPEVFGVTRQEFDAGKTSPDVKPQSLAQLQEQHRAQSAPAAEARSAPDEGNGEVRRGPGRPRRE